MENTSEFYYEKLKNSPSPGQVLSALYCSLYKINPTREEIIMMNKLVRIFGRFTLFFSILDMAGSYPDKVESPYPLLYKICKNKFEQSHTDVNFQAYLPLDRFINDIQKQVDELKKTKIKAPSPEGLGK